MPGCSPSAAIRWWRSTVTSPACPRCRGSSLCKRIWKTAARGHCPDLWRPLLPTLVEAVAPGGVLIYETFACGNERFGRPRNPDFLLRPGELLELVRGRLSVVAYESGITAQPAVMQRICAVNSVELAEL